MGQIYSLFETKKKRGVNIFDLYEGKDLVITVKRQVDSSGKEKMVYQIQDDEKVRPLADSEEKMEEWVNDPMKWDDVYSVKDYDYLSLIVMGEWPVWNKDMNKWIAKSEADKIATEAKQQEISENLKPESKDFSTFTVDSGFTKTEIEVDAREKSMFDKTDDSDLPF